VHLDDEFAYWAREVSPGISRIELVAPDMHCAGCISRIERALNGHPAVTMARVNMSTKRVTVEWSNDLASAGAFVELLAGLGYKVHPFAAAGDTIDRDKAYGRRLLLCLAVAGFAAANVMLLSVSVWSGAVDATRDMFHWVSALIALPTIAFAGRPFFTSAWTALRAASLNMDVPISLAVILAGAMSLFETITHGEEAYFDAAVTLLFFLLIGRYLDHTMRVRARDTVARLAQLSARSATVVDDGTRRQMSIATIHAGMTVAIAAGERIPVDGIVTRGSSDIDQAMLTGESLPEAVSPGGHVHEGTINLTQPLQVRVEARGGETLLADIIRTMEAAESRKAGYVRLADTAARVYAPVVHLAAFATFLGWLWISGGDWHMATFTAIAVLIITCPCALGLAVPVVQVVASGVLFRNGIVTKNGEALERMAQVDTVVFDKTGTLTLGRPRLVSPAVVDVTRLAIAGGISGASRHPLSRAVSSLAAARGVAPVQVEDIEEHPGCGLAGTFDGIPVRLGSRHWCGLLPDEDAPDLDHRLELCLQVGNDEPTVFRFEDAPRLDAVATMAELKRRQLDVEIVSGDRPAAVDHIAAFLGVTRHRAQIDPADKARHVLDLALDGHKVLMVGDGINDAPALAAGYTSMAPSSAADIGRTAADFVFFGESLAAVAVAHDISRRARRLVIQNFALAAGYNLIAVPIAVLGFASPLVAAIAMSASSLVVSLNAMRLRMPGSSATLLTRSPDTEGTTSDDAGTSQRSAA
jgi:Cu2+-exporting ATPase